jgi:hemolysin activation/secretion protein
MWQGVVGAVLNNPVGDGDQVSLNGIFAQGSKYTQGSYNVPLGASGLRLNLSASYLSYTNIGNFATNGGDGTAAVLSADLSYPLIREQATNLNLTARFDNKSYLNNNLATGVVASQYSLNSINFGATGNHFDDFLGGGVTTASIGLVYGQLSVSGKSPASYGSFVDAVDNYVRYLPATYAKITYNLNRNQTLVADKLLLKLNLSGQFATVNLNSAEQFYLGGPYGIRAYPVSQAGGSQGAMLNIELQKKLPHGTTAIAFFDAGTVQQYKYPYPGWKGATNAGNIYSLAGAGVGIRYVSKGLTLAATIAWRVGSNPLYSQAGFAVNTDSTNTNPTVWLSMGYQL